TPGAIDAIAVRVTPNEFVLPRGKAVLGFTMRAADSSSLDPGPIRLSAARRRDSRILLSRSDAAGPMPNLTLAAGRPGRLTITAGADRGTPGAYQLDVFLVGDVNGDFRVDRHDLKLIRSAMRARSARSHAESAADVDHDGHVGPRDLSLARLNRGV